MTWELLSDAISVLVGGSEDASVAEMTEEPIIHLRKWLPGFGTQRLRLAPLCGTAHICALGPNECY